MDPKYFKLVEVRNRFITLILILPLFLTTLTLVPDINPEIFIFLDLFGPLRAYSTQFDVFFTHLDSHLDPFELI